MATSQDYLDFVLEQLPPLWSIRSRKMFGEYMIYLNDEPILALCDNTVFVKKLPGMRKRHGMKCRKKAYVLSAVKIHPIRRN